MAVLQVEPSELESLQSDASQSTHDNNDHVYPNLNDNPNANNRQANPRNNDEQKASRCPSMNTLFLVYCVLISTFNLCYNLSVKQQCECTNRITATESPEPVINETMSPTTYLPSYYPTTIPTLMPSDNPTISPTRQPSLFPSLNPTSDPTTDPTAVPTKAPTSAPTPRPTLQPTYDYDLYKNEIGDFKISAQDVSHGYWKLCDGSYLDANVYKDLFDVIGYSYGGNSDLNHFKLPNAMDSVLGIKGSDHDIGEYIGSETNVLLENNIPSHFHLTARYNDVPTCPLIPDNSPDDYAAAGCLDTETNPIQSVQVLAPTSQVPDWGRSSSVGNGDSFSVMQPTLFVGNLFIYTGVDF